MYHPGIRRVSHDYDRSIRQVLGRYNSKCANLGRWGLQLRNAGPELAQREQLEGPAKPQARAGFEQALLQRATWRH